MVEAIRAEPIAEEKMRQSFPVECLDRGCEEVAKLVCRLSARIEAGEAESFMVGLAGLRAKSAALLCGDGRCGLAVLEAGKLIPKQTEKP